MKKNQTLGALNRNYKGEKRFFASLSSVNNNYENYYIYILLFIYKIFMFNIIFIIFYDN